ncbi:MAG: OmpA family protein [Pseudomonadota bacterium]|nr:OmpA family protein [Pseudomonadota bacterium]
MNSFLVRLFLVISIVALLGACARKSVVVLLPDRDGKTGVIEVANQGGAQLLDAPNQATAIRSSRTAPESPALMPEERIKNMFGEAMEAMPPAPRHYILYFLSDSTQLTSESIRVMEELMMSISGTRPAEVSIVGHTDRVGDRSRNFRLGLERAAQVRQLLIQKGVDAGIVEITSHGEDNPLIKTDDGVAAPENRRVEIVIR